VYGRLEYELEFSADAFRAAVKQAIADEKAEAKAA
jgi:hypothetical protein